MKRCQKCGESFPSKLVIEGKERVLSSRKFCLKCSPWGEHNTNSEPNGTTRGTRRLQNRAKACVVCGRPRKRDKGRRCPTCETKIRRYRAKSKAVALLGGKCSACGWSGDIAAFQFHHKGHSEKGFEISDLLHKSWGFVEEELRKCVLLCANCHWTAHTIRPQTFYDEVARYQGRDR
jgi:hypothetical protein